MTNSREQKENIVENFRTFYNSEFVGFLLPTASLGNAYYSMVLSKIVQEAAILTHLCLIEFPTVIN